MADIRLAKPVAGTTQTVPSAPDGRFIFDFPADAATLTRNGDDLVLSFEDGSSIRLQGFYTTYSKEDMPSFQVEGVEISGEDFFAALGEDLMPAAGPAAGSSASRGGRYNEYGGSDLLDGIDHLGRLDIGFDDGVEWADDEVGGWTHQNLDPEISGIIAVDGNDMTLVESGVETVPGEDIQDNTHTPGVPVVVGQVVAHDPDGGSLSYSFAGGANSITTEYGVITIDAATGVITYTLHNDDPDTNSLKLDETVTEKFSVIVRDNMGGSAQASFTVTIKGTNDQPEVTLDADSELKLTESGVGRTEDGQVVTAPGTEDENQAYDGSHADGTGTQQLEGKVTGADVDAGHKLWFGVAAGDKSQDGSWEGAEAPAAGDFLEQDSTVEGEDSKSVVGTFGTLTLSSDGTWVYTLKGEQDDLPEGVEITLDGKIVGIGSIDELPEGAEVTDTFTIYVKDEHGAWNLETVTITITGTNDRPKLEVGDPDKTLYESGVGRDPATGVPVGDPGHENDPYDNATAGTHTTTGTITASDVDLGNTLHFAVSKKGEATEVPQDKLTDTDRSVTAQGSYGKLVVQETGNGEATYTYTLNENSDDIPLSVPVTINGTTYDDLEALKDALQFDGDRLTLNNLPEGATVTDTFTIFVQDDKGAWVSKDVTITIKGTNDQPTVELDREHSQLHLFESGVGRYENGDIVRNPGGPDENNAYNGSTELTGKVTGADVDAGYKLWFGVAAGDKSKDGSWEGAEAPAAGDFLE
ncbi:VCBS domain-containing protein, partial [Desulfovibrio piger]|uniref:VCBS domain-containing protein n=1 Tax=Desulfovibrio piger TaxID=901 RepID=UPI0026F12FAC